MAQPPANAAGAWLSVSGSGARDEFDQRIRDLLRYWHDNRGPNGVPDRSAFSPDLLHPWIGNLSVYEKIEGEDDFVVRLEGTGISMITGEDWTGRRLSEIDLRYGTQFRGDVHTVLARRQPSMTQCQVFQRVYKPAERILLPVASAPGIVDQVFLCLYVMTE